MVSFKNAREEAFLNIATIQGNHTRLCLCGLEFSNVVSGSRDFKKNHNESDQRLFSLSDV